MKTTKRIKTIAADIASKDCYVSLSYAERVLTELKHAMLNGRYYTSVDTVSRSGMSRTITIKYIYNGKLQCVPQYVYKLAGCDTNHRIGGCGMDMLFAAQYNLFMQLVGRSKRTPYQSHMKRYNEL